MSNFTIVVIVLLGIFSLMFSKGAVECCITMAYLRSMAILEQGRKECSVSYDLSRSATFLHLGFVGMVFTIAVLCLMP